MEYLFNQLLANCVQTIYGKAVQAIALFWTLKPSERRNLILMFCFWPVEGLHVFLATGEFKLQFASASHHAI